MKKKKNFTLLGLVVAVLVLGIGYAISSIDLKVNGDVKISPDDSNFIVEFTNANVAGDKDTATIGDGKTATLHVETLKTVGDEVVATYTITNKSKAGLNATLTNPTVNYTADDAKGYYEVTAVLADTNAIAPNGTETLTVTVKLVKAPFTEVTGNFEVAFQATPQQG